MRPGQELSSRIVGILDARPYSIDCHDGIRNLLDITPQTIIPAALENIIKYCSQKPAKTAFFALLR
ncbi:MAG: hypothetical protein ACJAW3_001417 [Lentimonas sp.]|jgi:hypothetical protein